MQKILKKITLNDIDNFPNPEFLVERISIVNNFPMDFSGKLLREVKRMLFLSVISGEKIAPSNRIDYAWHEMLMYTKFYKDFSNFIGGHIHHIPFRTKRNDYMETYEDMKKNFGKEVRGSDTYNNTKKNYKKFFTINPDNKYWP